MPYIPKHIKRELGYDTRPGHKGRTMAGKILSVKGLYDKAVQVLQGNLDQGDLKAAIFAIEQVDGKAKQKIELGGKMEVNTPQYDFNGISIEKQRAIRDALKAAQK